MNAAHILGIGLLFGAIATLDLRLLGAFRAAPLALFGPPLWRMAAFGLGLAALTGSWLFTTRPGAYLENPAFLAKLGLIGAALLNLAVLHRQAAWGRALAGAPVAAPVRAAAVVSLVAWVGTVVAGRWIGFLQ